MSLTVVGVPLSPFVRKVRVLLAEKGVDYALDPVNPFVPPADFRKISPLGKVPALRDGDKTLCDSSVICAYLERRFSQVPMYPKDDYGYARSLWFEEYADSGLFPAVGPGCFMPLIVNPLLGKARDPELAKKTVAQDLPPLFDHLESEIGAKTFLVNNTFSIADIAIASQFVNLRHADVRPDPARWPKLAAYVQKIHARPSFAACIVHEDKILKPH
jgi:glutathione S-transferase